MRNGALTLRGGYYNHAIRQVAYLYNKVTISIQVHALSLSK